MLAFIRVDLTFPCYFVQVNYMAIDMIRAQEKGASATVAGGAPNLGMVSSAVPASAIDALERTAEEEALQRLGKRKLDNEEGEEDPATENPPGKVPRDADEIDI